jgi:methionyl-tRNA formyltransferase
MDQINIVFFGTNNFATIILQGLIDSPFIEIAKVVTMPDKPVGRKKQLQSSPVKLLALEHDLKIDQPEKLKNYDIGNSDYELNIIVDYGMIIPQNIIDTPKFGSINIHPSLLPKYRGPSPIQSVLIDGQTETGISIMLIDKEMDHGPILAQESFEIDKDDTYPELSKKLAKKAVEMLLTAISDYTDDKIKPKNQDHDQATFCKMLTRESGIINFDKTAQEIYNQYRGLIPWPGIYTKIKNEELKIKNLRLKLLDIKPSNKKIDQRKIVFEDDKIFIGYKDSSIEVLELQLEGKKPATAKNFINGNTNLHNSNLDEE